MKEECSRELFSKGGFEALGSGKSIFEVHNAGDDIKFYAVTSAFVVVAVRHNFEHFDATENVLDTDSEPGKPSVVSLFLSV